MEMVEEEDEATMVEEEDEATVDEEAQIIMEEEEMEVTETIIVEILTVAVEMGATGGMPVETVIQEMKEM
jgi:hypothetical protein